LFLPLEADFFPAFFPLFSIFFWKFFVGFPFWVVKVFVVGKLLFAKTLSNQRALAISVA
jgi:hypothetical protein